MVLHGIQSDVSPYGGCPPCSVRASEWSWTICNNQNSARSVLTEFASQRCRWSSSSSSGSGWRFAGSLASPAPGSWFWSRPHCVSALAEAGRADLQRWMFSGVGAGIAAAGLGCVAMMAGGVSSGDAWLIFGALALVIAATIWIRLGSAVPLARPSRSACAAERTSIVWSDVLAYGTAELDYIVPDTICRRWRAKSCPRHGYSAADSRCSAPPSSCRLWPRRRCTGAFPTGQFGASARSRWPWGFL